MVSMLGPHDWSEREVTLVNIVAERTWLAVEKLRLDNMLRETDQTLRDADRRKDEFLATLAHELRNPLSLIRNVVALQKAPDSIGVRQSLGSRHYRAPSELSHSLDR